MDYTLNAKAVNPSPGDLTGIYIGSYLQSVSKNLALGVEGILQRQSPDMADVATAYLAKYTSTDKSWIATAQLQGAGILQATYWQKLSDKVDVAADLQVVAAPGRRDALATLAARYELRMASFRAQLDSTGKVSAFLEQKFAPTFSFLVSGEIDHLKVRAQPPVCPHRPADSSSHPFPLFHHLYVCLVLVPAERGEGRRGRDDREQQHDPGGDGPRPAARPPPDADAPALRRTPEVPYDPVEY